MEQDLPKYYRGERSFGVRCKAIVLPPEQRRKPPPRAYEYYLDHGLRPPFRLVLARWRHSIICSVLFLAVGLLLGYLFFA